MPGGRGLHVIRLALKETCAPAGAESAALGDDEDALAVTFLASTIWDMIEGAGT